MIEHRHIKPTIWIYGGVHYDPGSRQRFLEELAKHTTAPHFVAVEWEQSVFERCAEWRPWIAESLSVSGAFLTPDDRRELSLALAWEGDAYAERFPGTAVLWLENGFQEADLIQRYGTDANKAPESFADGLRKRIWQACLLRPEPRSKQELIERVSKTLWDGVERNDTKVERDARWAHALCERSADLHGSWVAVVVGWHHGDPAASKERLRGLLLSKGFSVHSVCLGPPST